VQASGFVTLSQLTQDLGWEKIRAENVLDYLVCEGMAWVDSQSKEKEFWFPGFFGTS
jgi:ESCRT-II complex subunit VPS22